jgi:hypothetical protein
MLRRSLLPGDSLCLKICSHRSLFRRLRYTFLMDMYMIDGMVACGHVVHRNSCFQGPGSQPLCLYNRYSSTYAFIGRLPTVTCYGRINRTEQVFPRHFRLTGVRYFLHICINDCSWSWGYSTTNCGNADFLPPSYPLPDGWRWLHGINDISAGEAGRLTATGEYGSLSLTHRSTQSILLNQYMPMSKSMQWYFLVLLLSIWLTAEGQLPMQPVWPLATIRGIHSLAYK